MANVLGGYQPDTRSASARRADFDLRRRIAAAIGGGGNGDGSLVLPPAYAGPRSDNPTSARFGNTVRPGYEGLTVTDDGTAAVVTSNARALALYQRNAADNGFDWIANFANAAGTCSVQTVGLGNHTAFAGPAIWPKALPDNNLNNYTLGMMNDNTWTMVNATTTVRLRVNNADKLSVLAEGIDANTRMSVYYEPGNNDWTSAHVLCYPQGSTSSQARISMHSPGIAPQIRAVALDGEVVGHINNPGTNWVPCFASAFTTVSTAVIKQDVRTLRPERERIVVHHPWDADIVPPPDIMALRPVTFRPLEELISNDTETDEPRTGIIGHEERRERLGLIAEDVQHVLPSAVTHNAHGEVRGIDYAQVTVALLDHVQRLTDEVATLRYRIAELESQ